MIKISNLLNNDFTSNDTRRLDGLLHNMRHNADAAIQKMAELLEQNPDITVQEAFNHIRYEMTQLGLSNYLN